MKSLQEREVGAFEARKKFSSLLDAASRGERIWITKYGKRMALLCSGLGTVDSETENLVEEFRKIRASAKPGKETLKELIEEGRGTSGEVGEELL